MLKVLKRINRKEENGQVNLSHIVLITFNRAYIANKNVELEKIREIWNDDCKSSLIICPRSSGLKQKRTFLNRLFKKLLAICKAYHVRNHCYKFTSGSSRRGVNSSSKQSSTFFVTLINAGGCVHKSH